MSAHVRAAARLRVDRSILLVVSMALGALLALSLLAPPAAAHSQAPEAPAAPAGLAGLGPSVLAEAARQRGKPYRWGAAGPDAFDCSGYTSYVYRRVGRRLPRTAGSQYAAVRHVSSAAKHPGDLIFNYDYRGRIYHVGIYAGAGSVWHAPGRGSTVRRSPIWNSTYWVGRVS